MSDVLEKPHDSGDNKASIARDKQHSFVALVGERIREVRLLQGLSRRVVSERSGISQRYIAQLEGGQGNISIALLHKIAGALGCETAWFVREPGEAGSYDTKFETLFALASEEQKRQVLEMLMPGMRGPDKESRVALIGLRGAGKSTLGRLAGEALNVPFVELNRDIESESGMAVNETFALYGQEGYRVLERAALERVVSGKYGETLILEVAGGIVSEPETYDYLLTHFNSIWVKATPEEHMGRVRAQGDERPMAGNTSALDDLRIILQSREAQYARANAVVDTGNSTLDESLRRLVLTIKENDFLPAAQFEPVS